MVVCAAALLGVEDAAVVRLAFVLEWVSAAHTRLAVGRGVVAVQVHAAGHAADA